MKSLLSNAELDSLAIESDTRSGERMITRLSAFLARFVSYPSEHALVAHALVVCTYAFDGSVGVYAPHGIPLSRAGVGQNQGARDYRVAGA